MRFNGAPHRVHLLVKPVADEAGAESRNAIVIFIEGEAVDESLLEVDSQADAETVRRLTQELELTQARLRTVREEFGLRQQELRAANEELQSINEEYRSTSEELETSRKNCSRSTRSCRPSTPSLSSSWTRSRARTATCRT